MTLDVDCRMSTFPRSNEKSLLLSDQENESLFNVLGKGCVTLATAVVQLFLADSVNKHAWNMRSYGVVCFVKDSPKRSFFLRVYDVLTLKKSWEQEIYLQFKYNTPREFFHTFEADDCQAGLNFASVDEAGIFKATVQRKLQERLERRIQKRKTREAGNRNTQQKHGNKILNSGPLLPSGNVPLNKNVISKTKSPDKAKEKGKKKLTKADISTPTEFRHVGHAGWDPNSGLQTDNLDPEMRVLFEEMGITHSQVDEDTVNFIYDFVDKHGGLNALREDIAKRKPPPVPPPSTDHFSGSHAGKASPLPPRPNFAAPKPPSREPRPPPPPDRSAKRSALPPLPPSRDGHHSGGPSRGIPPPPPNIPPPPPSPPPAFDAPPPPPVKPSGESRAPPPSSGRACLLDAIVNFKGSALKPVEPDQEDKPVTSSSEAPGGITAALMAALDIRNTAVQYSDDEDENSDDLDDDDDEWDD